MTVEKRMKMVRIIEKMEQNEKYSEKIGLKNKSYFGESKEENRYEIHSSGFGNE